MPIIVCPGCETGVDVHVTSEWKSLKDGGKTHKIGFCRLCQEEIYLITSSNDNTVYYTYPQLVPKTPDELPEEVREAFHEALLCQTAGAPNGAALMCRRTLQSALDDLNAPEGNLPTQLQALVTSYRITPELKEWADHARIGGRIAAHASGGEDWGMPDLEWVTREDAEAVIEFLSAFLEHVYVLPARNLARRQKTGIEPAPQSETDSNVP